MKYNKHHVGEKIAEMRNRMNLTQVELIEKCRAIVDADSESVPFSLRTLGSWENGNDSITLKNLILISQALECSVGYLLGEYDKRTLEAEDICNTTGLSEAAVNELLKDNKQGFISYFIENGKDIFATLGDYVQHERSLQEIKSLPYYELIEEAFNEAQEKDSPILNASMMELGLRLIQTREDYFYEILEAKLKAYYDDDDGSDALERLLNHYSSLSAEEQAEVLSKYGDYETRSEQSFDICRFGLDCYNVLEMKHKQKYYKHELSDNFMKLVIDYIGREGAEDGREN